MISKPFTARFKVCIVAAVVVTLWYIRLLPPVGPGWSLYTSKHLPRDAAANATLGVSCPYLRPKEDDSQGTDISFL